MLVGFLAGVVASWLASKLPGWLASTNKPVVHGGYVPRPDTHRANTRRAGKKSRGGRRKNDKPRDCDKALEAQPGGPDGQKNKHSGIAIKEGGH